MKLIINGQALEFKMNNTNFVDYWMSTVFGGSNTKQIFYNEHHLHYEKERFNATAAKLNECIAVTNIAAEELSLGDTFKFPICNNPTPKYLETVHEQWATITRKSRERHLPLFNESYGPIYKKLNDFMNLSEYKFDDINTLVHRLEHLYEGLFIMNLELPDVNFKYKEYLLTPDDFTFDVQSLQLPFYDIGRPQYEKWSVSRSVEHFEISNYNNIANRIEFCGNPVRRLPDPQFIIDCDIAGVEPLGNRLGIGNALNSQLGNAGFTILSNITSSINLTLEK